MCWVLLLVLHSRRIVLYRAYTILKTVSLVFPELGGYKVSINTCHVDLKDFSDKTLVKLV